MRPPEAGADPKTSDHQIGINYAAVRPTPLKVYLSVPMIANRALLRARLLAKAIEDSGHEVTSPWVLGPVERSGTNAVNVFRRDKKGAEDCDTLVADVTDPSVGVGMEIMAAYYAGRRIILVGKKGKVTSRMLSHMDRKETLEYDADEDVYPALMGVLGKGAEPGEKPI